jgi:hypothetical protein
MIKVYYLLPYKNLTEIGTTKKKINKKNLSNQMLA